MIGELVVCDKVVFLPEAADVKGLVGLLAKWQGQSLRMIYFLYVGRRGILGKCFIMTHFLKVIFIFC